MSPTQPVCLITGASAGIGAALAREFARAGHRLALTARSQDGLAAVADEIAAAGHARPQTIAADLGHPDGVAHLAEALSAAGLEPAFLVNNAGFGLLGAADAAPDRHLAIIDLNCRALTDLSLRWIDSITRQRGGILNVASVAAFLPGPGMTVYHATKAYVLSLTEALHSELASEGVRVCALCPGPVPTGFNKRGGIPDGFFPDYLACSAEEVARAGYEGFMGGHRVVVPGRLNRLATLLPRLLPRDLVREVMQRRWRKARRGG